MSTFFWLSEVNQAHQFLVNVIYFTIIIVSRTNIQDMSYNVQNMALTTNYDCRHTTLTYQFF